MDSSEWADLEYLLASDEGEHTALNAALAWLDDADLPPLPQATDGSMSQPESSTESSSVTSEEPLKPRKRRLNRRDEVKLLRVTVQQLEARLSILKERSGKVRPPSVAQEGESTGEAWKRVAISQVNALQESERENTRLRTMLEDQVRLIKGLERLVMKKRSKTFSWCPEYSSQSTGADPIEDAQVEKEMNESIDEMLLDVDRILADERLQGDDANEPVNVTEVISDDQDQLVIEEMSTRMFPFKYQGAASALWNMWTATRVHMINNLRRRDVLVNGDSVRAVLEGEFQVNHVSARFRAKTIGRRVIENDRIIMPGVLLVEPMIMVDGKPLKGVFLRIRIWNIFRNTPGDSPVASRVFYSQCMPMTFGSNEDKAHQGIAALTNIMLQTSGVRVNMNNQIIENQLLENFAKMGLSDTT
ncbi:hypothetical protein Poli38472_011842 [Pythium oligandrum]|uniref:Uncharacterized protein n=1 Tax=Pythium oligandrum TaxID=41045 RepID=A0A8K1C7U1_PYTOL|nr:hypothetical protein Poli38472_011842 [Pythium oligandrum]|eukprot:TMW58254.1 hypothetical protein Poli38472_011842 [Pythium oligandrum]